MPFDVVAMHGDNQRKIAAEVCRGLRILDDGVRKEVLRFYRDSDLPGCASRIEQSVKKYETSLRRNIGRAVAGEQS